MFSKKKSLSKARDALVEFATFVQSNPTLEELGEKFDIPGFIKTLQKTDFTGFVGLNTLFVALCAQEDFRALDFSKLKLTVSGLLVVRARRQI